MPPLPTSAHWFCHGDVWLSAQRKIRSTATTLWCRVDRGTVWGSDRSSPSLIARYPWYSWVWQRYLWYALLHLGVRLVLSNCFGCRDTAYAVERGLEYGVFRNE